VVADLVDLGVLREPAVVRRTATIDVGRAYPVPTHDRAARVAEIRAWLAERGIHTVGRLGEWEYVNSDECLRRGLALGRSLARALASGEAGEAAHRAAAAPSAAP
jgi:protoporphyrinogen oxidase